MLNPDLSYEVYEARIAGLVSPGGIAADAADSSPSRKFVRHDSGWQPEPFHGVTVITPPCADDTVNHGLYVALADLQQAVIQRFGLADIGLLPVSSLHMTVADLLYAADYRPYRQDADRASDLHQQIAGVFESVGRMPVQAWRVRGLSAFGAGVTAVLDCAPDDYQRLMRLRAAIYDLPGVAHPGTFTAHISFFYRQYTDPAVGARLAGILTALNHQVDWQALPAFQVYRAELRAFADMAAYSRQPGWPVYVFG